MYPKKTKVTSELRVNAYLVMSNAVEEGVAYGWNRAHKHTDAPDPAAIRDAIEAAVMGAICEYFTFTEETHD